jgi:hypothetical protein
MNVNGQILGKELKITTLDLLINKGGSINTIGRGYDPNSGTGRGICFNSCCGGIY